MFKQCKNKVPKSNKNTFEENNIIINNDNDNNEIKQYEK